MDTGSPDRACARVLLPLELLGRDGRADVRLLLLLVSLLELLFALFVVLSLLLDQAAGGLDVRARARALAFGVDAGVSTFLFVLLLLDDD